MKKHNAFPRERETTLVVTTSGKSTRHHETTTKRRGELAEMAFMLKARTLGFRLAKPFGDSERYDVIVDSGKSLWRVQVKSTTTILNGRYHVNSHRRTNGNVVAYDPSEIDFLVAYIIPEDAWFILPIQAILTRTSLLFCFKDDPKGGLYGTYREAWHLLRESVAAPA
jgi:hypothetical protein